MGERSRVFLSALISHKTSENEIDAVAAARPQELTVEYKEPIAIVKSAAAADEFGNYSYSFEGANGIRMNEEGEQKQIGDKPEEVGTVSRGSYSYELEGVTYTVNW